MQNGFMENKMKTVQFPELHREMDGFFDYDNEKRERIE